MSLPQEAVEKIVAAGKIVSKVKRELRAVVRPGASYLEVARFAEDLIRSLGGDPAFPCNISVGSEAAHYSPLIGDNRKVPEEGVVKVDVGAHVDGYLADAAISFDFSGEHEVLVTAVKEALSKAIEAVAPGVRVSAIGETIEKVLSYYGVKPVKNLSGHAMERYKLHTGFTVPNARTEVGGVIKPGMLLAIEPFATRGLGYVVEGPAKTIYSFVKPYSGKLVAGSVGDALARAYVERKGLPFTERWYADERTKDEFRSALSALERSRVVYGYRVLVEASGHQVAQAEETVLVLEKEVVVTTE